MNVEVMETEFMTLMENFPVVCIEFIKPQEAVFSGMNSHLNSCTAPQVAWLT